MRRTTQSAIGERAALIPERAEPSPSGSSRRRCPDSFMADTARRCRGPVLLLRRRSNRFRAPRRCCDCRLGMAGEYIDDRDKILSHAVGDLGALQAEMGSDNFQMSGGRIDAENQVRLVRSLSRFDDIDTLKKYPVQNQLVLSDIADVAYKSAVSASINRLNGQRAVVVAVWNESGANRIEVGKTYSVQLQKLRQIRDSPVLFLSRSSIKARWFRERGQPDQTARSAGSLQSSFCLPFYGNGA